MFLQGSTPSNWSPTNNKVSASAFEPHDLIWIDLGFHPWELGHAIHQVFDANPFGTSQLLFGVSHGNPRGKSQPGGCNPVEITMSFQFRNTFPSGVKRLWMWQMVFQFWERLGGSWCKFYCHNCSSLPSWELRRHCASKNCPHKDRKLSNRGIVLVHRANVKGILNNNFKT